MVKIDSNLISEATTNHRDQVILHCLARMAREMGKRTIAEGVTDADTLDLLRDLGIDYAQGYFIGRPRPVPQLAAVR